MEQSNPQIKLGVLASHRGSNFQAILDAIESGILNARVTVAISNNSNSEALNRARWASIDCYHFSGKTHPDPQSLDLAIADALSAGQVDYVVTAGYMKKLGVITLQRFARKVINIHPSLLPKYGGQGMYGMNVHKEVIRQGETVSGLTVHLVDAEYDTGPILAQKVVAVESDDTPQTLASRIIAEEHQLLVKTLIRVANGSLPTQT